MNNRKKILITGAAGFIGYSLCFDLLKNKNNYIIGIDNLNSYYSPKLKKKRLQILRSFKNFLFYKIDISKKNELTKIFKKHRFSIVFNFAAQAGVRFSFENPDSYLQSNIKGFYNLICLVKSYKVNKFFFASSSSVYGDVKPYPKKEESKLYPLNIYSLSKITNENLAESFSKNMKTKIIGLRFFTIYGEWGRPDMMILKYLKASKERKPFLLYNHGKHYRDFTYINDAIRLVKKLIYKKNLNNYEIYNICSSKPILITKILNYIDKFINPPKILKKPKHSADVLVTYGDNKKILKKVKNFNFTDYKTGIINTVYWFIKNKKFFN